ncbi:type II glyceraldehyde-3-phosphate dehydrogenase [Caldiplasma sukawensis]
MIRVGINGYGTIGRRVADAIRLQKDMTVTGIVKVTPDYVAKTAMENYTIYTSTKENMEKFKAADIQVEGTIEDLIEASDIIVDASPEGQGEKNMEMYRKKKVKAIVQGGESEKIVESSFNAYSNFMDSWGKDFVRVVSCNTTGLARTLSSVNEMFGIRKVEATLVRRATDPNDSKKGPINGVEPSLKFPSHHGPDLKTVLNVPVANTVAIKVPTTLMHVHTVMVETEKNPDSETFLAGIKNKNRIIVINGKSGLISTAQVMDMAREMGRKRGDLFEIALWKESIYAGGNTFRYIQAVHQESDVVPENVDAIRAMMQEAEKEKSIEMTDKAMEMGKVK